jgi:hypothetical protein
MIFRIFCLFGVLHQAVRAVSKERPKPPMLDIPFQRLLKFFIGSQPYNFMGQWHPKVGAQTLQVS